jgi:pimeloyl-ACP methyl ester carboxylesterase
VQVHADDAAALASHLQLGPCLLVASSGGARIGVDLLRRYPKLFTAAVLSEPPIFGLDPAHGGAQIQAHLAPLLESAFARRDPAAAVDAFFDYLCPGLWGRLDEAQKAPYRANYRELMGDLQMPSYEITADDLDTLDTPSAVVSGTTSHPVLRRVARVLAERMPRARFVELEGIGHVTYAEAPAAFANVVREMSRVLDAVPKP